MIRRWRGEGMMRRWRGRNDEEVERGGRTRFGSREKGGVEEVVEERK